MAAVVCLMLLLPDELLTEIIIHCEDHVWFKDRWMVASLCDE
jgi:hypothetical protein